MGKRNSEREANVNTGPSVGHGLCSVPEIFGIDGGLRHVASDGHQYRTCSVGAMLGRVFEVSAM
jgi:hypothetical protein